MSVLSRVKLPKDLKKLSFSELQKLNDELRDYTIEIVSKTGGHLGASLGVVELTVALHYVFNTPSDKLIWDVGHQTYPHKILTGRKNKIHSLRKKNGISGFTKRSESIYDPFGAAHSSTSISAGLGITAARDILNKNFDVVSVIGDGAISAGMAFEGLNNLGHLNKNSLIILNDNEMSISPNVGAMNKYLTKILSGKTMSTIKQKGEKFLSDEHPIKKIIKKIKDNAQNLLSPGHLFEEIGFRYYGPIDGHDISSLNKILDNLKDKSGPILLHVITKKGKGIYSIVSLIDNKID